MNVVIRVCRVRRGESAGKYRWRMKRAKTSKWIAQSEVCLKDAYDANRAADRMAAFMRDAGAQVKVYYGKYSIPDRKWRPGELKRMQVCEPEHPYELLARQYGVIVVKGA